MVAQQLFFSTFSLALQRELGSKKWKRSSLFIGEGWLSFKAKVLAFSEAKGGDKPV